jgi:hypothetical protein
MKHILFIAIAVAGFAACNMEDKKTAASAGPKLTAAQLDSIKNDTTSYTTIQWTDSLPVNIGKMTDGEERELAFHFKNTGNKPLIIIDTRGTCGCTTPEKPEGAILPGQEGVIKAKFNSSGMGGRMISKTLTVTANTNPSSFHELTFTGEVAKKD